MIWRPKLLGQKDCVNIGKCFIPHVFVVVVFIRTRYEDHWNKTL